MSSTVNPTTNELTPSASNMVVIGSFQYGNAIPYQNSKWLDSLKLTYNSANNKFYWIVQEQYGATNSMANYLYEWDPKTWGLGMAANFSGNVTALRAKGGRISSASGSDKR